MSTSLDRSSVSAVFNVSIKNCTCTFVSKFDSSRVWYPTKNFNLARPSFYYIYSFYFIQWGKNNNNNKKTSIWFPGSVFYLSSACVNACMGVTVVGVVSGSPALPVLHLQPVQPLNPAPSHHSLPSCFSMHAETCWKACWIVTFIHALPTLTLLAFAIYSLWSFQYWSSALINEFFSWLFSTLPKCHSACVPASRNTWKHCYLQQSSWGFIFIKCVTLFNFHPNLSLQGNFDTSDLFWLGQCDAEDQFIIQDLKR